jgi:beta-glucosidase
MTAYNPVNGVHCSQNAHLITDILKGIWGFTGVVMSDWSSTHDAVAAANAGLDLEMPTAEQMNEKNLMPALGSGILSPAVIDDKVRRLLRLALRFGWLDAAQCDSTIAVDDSRNLVTALDIARSGVVLLKNDNNLLPLNGRMLKKVAVLGPNAHPAIFSGGGSAFTRPTRSISVLDGLRMLLGAGVELLHEVGPEPHPTEHAFLFRDYESDLGPGLRGEYFEGDTFVNAPALVSLDEELNFIWGPSTPLSGSMISQFSVRWTGIIRIARSGKYSVCSQGYDNSYRIWLDGKLIVDSWNGEQHGLSKVCAELSRECAHTIKIEWSKTRYWSGMQFGVALEVAPKSSVADCTSLARDAEAAIVCVGFNEQSEGEGFDRPFAMDADLEHLIREVSRVQPNTLVVVNAGGGIDMRNWIHVVPSLLYAFYPGQEGGRAIAEIIVGALNPSGKLPITIEINPEDGSAFDCYRHSGEDMRVQLSDGLLVGYRHFDEHGIKPLFPFGYGLSYTQFAFENIALSSYAIHENESIEVSFDIVNTGACAGAEVAQLYIRDFESTLRRPQKELKAFAKVYLESGERRRITLILDRRALEYFDPTLEAFVVEPGQFEVLVGCNSESIGLHAVFSVLGNTRQSDLVS